MQAFEAWSMGHCQRLNPNYSTEQNTQPRALKPRPNLDGKGAFEKPHYGVFKRAANDQALISCVPQELVREFFTSLSIPQIPTPDPGPQGTKP